MSTKINTDGGPSASIPARSGPDRELWQYRSCFHELRYDRKQRAGVKYEAHYVLEDQHSGTMFLIWSNEHNAWWMPNEAGYTQSKKKAGRYCFAEACGIVAGANRFIKDSQPPNEAMVEVVE